MHHDPDVRLAPFRAGAVEALAERRQGRRALLVVGGVHVDVERLGAERLDLRLDLVHVRDRRTEVEVDAADPVAVRGERERGGLAHAGGCSEDQGPALAVVGHGAPPGDDRGSPDGHRRGTRSLPAHGLCLSAGTRCPPASGSHLWGPGSPPGRLDRRHEEVGVDVDETGPTPVGRWTPAPDSRRGQFDGRREEVGGGIDGIRPQVPGRARDLNPGRVGCRSDSPPGHAEGSAPGGSMRTGSMTSGRLGILIPEISVSSRGA